MESLPDKPSELIRLALNDLKKCEKSEDYIINMGVYHHYHGAIFGTCSVCLAGAVMAQTLKLPKATDVNNVRDFFSEVDTFKLKALDQFRTGDIMSGLMKLSIRQPKHLPHSIHIDHYCMNPDRFHTQMEGLATLLEKFDL